MRPYKFVMEFANAGQTIGELEALIAAYEPNAEFVHDRWAKTAVSRQAFLLSVSEATKKIQNR